MQLIILVHGMWGTARDFEYITDELGSFGFARYESIASKLKNNGSIENSADDLAGVHGIVYRTRSNEGYFTYDGIDICGLRVANEICTVVDTLKQNDVKITELSLVGYSMGGLMARYAIGLLDTRGLFANIHPHLFITTCSPHVGVNLLGQSKGARLFNAIGAWSMARTSRQAFLRDSDQPHGAPLFLYLTQQNTPWSRALSKFDRRVLYANVANDRRCEFYTAAAEKVDPFKNSDIHMLRGPFVPGYEPIVLKGSVEPDFAASGTAYSRRNSISGNIDGNEANGIGANGNNKNSLTKRTRVGSTLAWIWNRIRRVTRLTSLIVRVGVVLPLWFCAFLLNATFQSTASRVRIHTTLQSRQHLLDDIPDLLEASAEGMVEDVYRTVQGGGETSQLQLTPLMQQIVNQFNELGFEKYFLRIAGTPMAHSAAIMKQPKRKDYQEGRAAVKHLVDLLVG